MEITEDLLLVVPLRPPYLEADLSKSNAPTTKLCGLAFGDVVIQDDQAAVLALTDTSFTTPRRVNEIASRTASAPMMPLYCRAIASAL
jgi:hypothetical protein